MTQVPVNSYIVGQVWSQIVASGVEFEDMENPTVLVQVGNPGDVGSVEISDMLFTSTGPLAGLVAMEWNVKGHAQGAAAMWGTHLNPHDMARSKLTL
jgi:glucan 1,3-beta-glucosidase